jgi:hypothetical protein
VRVLLIVALLATGLARPAAAVTCAELAALALPATVIAVRLFMIPAMGHCPGTAGSEAVDFNPLALAAAWKNTGVAPERFAAGRYVNGTADRTTLVCAHPALPDYSGRGSVKDAASFACAAASAGTR